jgi:hypothetical protein
MEQYDSIFEVMQRVIFSIVHQVGILLVSVSAHHDVSSHLLAVSQYGQMEQHSLLLSTPSSAELVLSSVLQVTTQLVKSPMYHQEISQLRMSKQH